MGERIAIPENGMTKTEILKALGDRKAGDADFMSPKTWSLVYYLGDEHTALVREAYNLYFSENALNPLAFKSLRSLEHEIVRMAADLLGGDGATVGTMTSGGTESCLLAVKTWRDYARSKRPFLKKPEMILAETAHVAWEKGAEYFDVKIVRVPVGPDFRMDVAAVEKKITRNTVLVVASAPDYPHGMVDPIAELGALALKKKVPLHVDACLGGFFLPFAEKAGYPTPGFDFRIPGVSSISADLHKYAFAAKGASVLLYRDMEYFEKQFFVSESWPGGVFLSTGLLGTRPGGAIAAAWAALKGMGMEGYLAMARTTMEAANKLRAGIAAIGGLEIVGTPTGSVFSYRSVDPKLDIYAVGDRMEAKGWHIDRLQRPEGLHAMVTPRHAGVVDRYLADLAEAVAAVRANPELKRQGDAATYGMIARVPLRGAVRHEVFKMARQMYSSEGPGEAGLGHGGQGAGEPDRAAQDFGPGTPGGRE
ncbi:MAG TPA: aspartate aminotransferase family protein [Rectinemataceae bacterium]|nr:aspartate aminotransferase family protein [Rectinemataceae bacterium]